MNNLIHSSHSDPLRNRIGSGVVAFCIIWVVRAVGVWGGACTVLEIVRMRTRNFYWSVFPSKSVCFFCYGTLPTSHSPSPPQRRLIPESHDLPRLNTSLVYFSLDSKPESRNVYYFFSPGNPGSQERPPSTRRSRPSIDTSIYVCISEESQLSHNPRKMAGLSTVFQRHPRNQ